MAVLTDVLHRCRFAEASHIGVLPSAVFVVALLTSMAGLAFAMRSLPTGTAYAVWVGIGASLTVGYGMVTGAESSSLWRVLFLAMIIGGVIGLKAVDS